MALYQAENQWGGPDAPRHPGGPWIIGYRVGQNVAALKVSSTDDGQTLTGEMTYNGEGPIGFKGVLNFSAEEKAEAVA
ncbi:MAG: hypothetical protein GXP23_02615 [Gammaproteobacteria bacterium]|nr:hypothetical protein [Gammaproteobacteria bacterium]